MPQRGKRWWLRLGFNLLVLAFLVWAAFNFPWADTLSALRETELWLLAIAAVIHLLSFVAKGWAWQLLLKPVAPCRWWVCQEANMVGTAINNVSIMLVGEGTRAKIVRDRDAVPFGIGISSILWARVLEAVSYAFFLAIAPAFLHLPTYYRPVQIVSIALLGGLVVIYLARHWLLGRFAPLARWWEGIRDTIRSWRWARSVSEHTPESVKHAFRAIIEIPLVTPMLPWILLLSALNWAVQWVDIDITFRAVGVPISASASFAVMTLTNAAWLFRITPGNVGIVQGATVLALLPFGIPPNIAIVGGLVLQAVQALPPLFMALVLVGLARLKGWWGGPEGGEREGRG
jgi:uncharacterized protein (TIRG00374 family)